MLIMIEAHILDSWTGFPDRQSEPFAYAMILGGFGAPLFLFLAGVAVPLSAGAKLRRGASAVAASRAVAWRGLEVFGLAFLFRLQAWVLGGSAARTLLKVDILNIMGPSIAAAAAIWGVARSTWTRCAAFAAAMLAVTLATPVIRNLPIVMALPDPIQAYIRPVEGLTNFVFFPWMGFVFAGALVGVVLDAVRTRAQEQHANIGFAIAGITIAVAAYQLSFLPTPYRHSQFWTTSPSFFFLRVGMMTAAIAAAYGWRRARGDGWSPFEQLGRTSLFIYWIHVEMVYGVISIPLHKSLSLWQAWAAWAVFCVFMVWCAKTKERWESRRQSSVGSRSRQSQSAVVSR